MTRSTDTTSITRSLATAIVLLVAAVAAVTGAGPAQAAAKSFGSDLDSSVQPSNSTPAHECNGYEGQKCTWVMGEAYGSPGGEKSPKAGKLKKIKLIAGEAGSFKLQIVKTRKNGRSKLIANGPRIKYEGQTDENWDSGVYNVEKFKVNKRIPRGARLAIKTRKTSALRCSSGGANTLLHAPPLVKGAGFVTPASDDGCWLLLEGKVK